MDALIVWLHPNKYAKILGYNQIFNIHIPIIDKNVIKLRPNVKDGNQNPH